MALLLIPPQKLIFSDDPCVGIRINSAESTNMAHQALLHLHLA